MVSDVLSSQALEPRPAQVSRPAVQVVAMKAQEPAATSGKELPRPAPEPVDLSRVVEGLNRFMESTQRNLNFRFDEASGRTVITVVNPETDEIVRQIPSDELLALARTMREAGMLFDALA
jgi:flagellar protein FlaG